MLVWRPTVQYVTFVMGNVTADAANRISIARVRPKIIQPSRSAYAFALIAHACSG